MREVRPGLPSRRDPGQGGAGGGPAWGARGVSPSQGHVEGAFWGVHPGHQPDDCTGCSLCVEACPAKDKRNPSRKALNLAPRLEVREAMNAHWDFFLSLPETPRAGLKLHAVKDVQLLPPLFEFPGACAGCGETPYLRLLSQLFGDRLIVANATGCSSIYGGNLPTTPWSKNKEGRGPAWANSLFEDNAEFGLGMRLALDKKAEYAGGFFPSFGRLWERNFWNGSSKRWAPRRWKRGGRTWPSFGNGLRASRTPGPGTSWRWPRPSSPTPSGSWVGTAGPTISATGAWTTSWPAGPTSRSWSWTPRSTPTPAARPPRPRAWGRWPSSPWRASPPPKRTWPSWP